MKKNIVIGGGFFGLHVARSLLAKKEKVILLERNAELMSEASYYNQARVHRGYHYPRSLATGLSSQENYLRFCMDFNECIFDQFKSIYAISRHNSKVNAFQFFEFCRYINSPIQEADATTKNLFDTNLIEQAFLTEESCFDSRKLLQKILRDLEKKDVQIHKKALVKKISNQGDIFTTHLENGKMIQSDAVYICCYGDPNAILHHSNLPPIALTQQLAEIDLVEMPQRLKEYGITIMDGPFFSCLPFPSQSCHSLSHVRFTPHYQWSLDSKFPGQLNFSKKAAQSNPPSQFNAMKCDASRFVPLMNQTRLIQPFYMVKTLLPRNHLNDGRPIFCLKNYVYENLNIVIGAKIDNAFDLESII